MVGGGRKRKVECGPFLNPSFQTVCIFFFLGAWVKCCLAGEKSVGVSKHSYQQQERKKKAQRIEKG